MSLCEIIQPPEGLCQMWIGAPPTCIFQVVSEVIKSAWCDVNMRTASMHKQFPCSYSAVWVKQQMSLWGVFAFLCIWLISQSYLLFKSTSARQLLCCLRESTLRKADDWYSYFGQDGGEFSGGIFSLVQSVDLCFFSDLVSSNSFGKFCSAFELIISNLGVS